RPRRSDPDLRVVPEPPTPLSLATPEQQHAALGQFERARELLRGDGDRDYALQLLLSCCKLDPSSTLYRKTLRDFVRATQGRRGGRWLGSLTTLPARSRLRSAKRAGQHRRVLEEGEELLTRAPDDLNTQLDMAESAEALGLTNLAAWMLESARQQ